MSVTKRTQRSIYIWNIGNWVWAWWSRCMFGFST